MSDMTALEWRDYWKQLGIFDAVESMAQQGVPPSSMHAAYELDDNAEIHAYFDAAKDDHNELDARVVTAVHLYYLTRHGAEPVKLDGVLPGPAALNEPPLWWSRASKLGVTSYWFDIVSELRTKRFKRHAKAAERKLHRDAVCGKLTPQGVFLTILDSQQGEALVSVCSVVNGTPIIMTTKIIQGIIERWPQEVRTTANAMLHAIISGSDIKHADAVAAHDVIAQAMALLNN